MPSPYKVFLKLTLGPSPGRPGGGETQRRGLSMYEQMSPSGKVWCSLKDALPLAATEAERGGQLLSPLLALSRWSGHSPRPAPGCWGRGDPGRPPSRLHPRRSAPRPRPPAASPIRFPVRIAARLLPPPKCLAEGTAALGLDPASATTGRTPVALSAALRL